MEGIQRDNSKYQYLSYFGKATFGVFKYSIDELILEAFKLISPTWIPLSKVCTDLIGQEVWEDKLIPYIIAEVSITKEGSVLISTTGEKLDIDRLYLKDK